MKILKLGMRLWIALTSALSFFAGWIILAHSPKPAQPAASASVAPAAPLPTLAPLSPLDFGSGNVGPGSQAPAFVIQPQSPSVFLQQPIFRSGGS